MSFRFLWRHNATFAISRHYRRYDVFEEAEANRAAGKYDNASIDRQIEFYRKEGLKPYSRAKFPITSGRFVIHIDVYRNKIGVCMSAVHVLAFLSFST